MEDQERIARYLCSRLDSTGEFDRLHEHDQDDWIRMADQIIKELGYRKPGKLLSNPVEEAELAAIKRVREQEKEYLQKSETINTSARLQKKAEELTFGKTQLDKEGE